MLQFSQNQKQINLGSSGLGIYFSNLASEIWRSARCNVRHWYSSIQKDPEQVPLIAVVVDFIFVWFYL